MGEFDVLFFKGITLVERMPNIEPDKIKQLQRDWKDINELSECVGTEELVLSLRTELLFNLAILGIKKD